MTTPQLNSDIRIIAISGRIASGSTTLAKQLAKHLSWKHIEGGEIFWEAVRKKLGLDAQETDKRPDSEDVLFDRKLKEIIEKDTHIILEAKLAGFNAQNVPGVYKVLVVCEDENGNDHTEIRIDRLVNREGISILKAKEEVVEREKNDLAKWRKLYADNDTSWTYLDKKYYDLVVNTFDHNKEDALKLVLTELGQ
jgi:predicted cytidylate kinase